MYLGLVVVENVGGDEQRRDEQKVGEESARRAVIVKVVRLQVDLTIE